MTDRELLEKLASDMGEMKTQVNTRLDTIDNRLDTIEKDIVDIKQDIVDIKEHTEITRVAANELIEWAERTAGITNIKFPVEE